jgi:hypothetical protein
MTNREGGQVTTAGARGSHMAQRKGHVFVQLYTTPALLPPATSRRTADCSLVSFGKTRCCKTKLPAQTIFTQTQSTLSPVCCCPHQGGLPPMQHAWHQQQQAVVCSLAQQHGCTLCTTADKKTGQHMRFRQDTHCTKRQCVESICARTRLSAPWSPTPPPLHCCLSPCLGSGTHLPRLRPAAQPPQSCWWRVH